MSKDMTNDLLKAVVAHADGQIEKHKVNVLVQCKNSVGVAEHGDHVETIQKEMEQNSLSRTVLLTSQHRSHHICLPTSYIIYYS